VAIKQQELLQSTKDLSVKLAMLLLLQSFIKTQDTNYNGILSQKGSRK